MDSLPAELPRKPIKLSYDPEITLLGIRSEKTIIQKDTCTQKFLEPVSTISMTWKKHRCLSMNGERCGTCMYTISYKRERIWVISSELDEARACYTEWNKSEREKQISYINTHMWNLEKRHWWTYLQGKIRVSDMDKRIMDTAGKNKMDWIERVSLKYTDYHM